MENKKENKMDLKLLSQQQAYEFAFQEIYKESIDDKMMSFFEKYHKEYDNYLYIEEEYDDLNEEEWTANMFKLRDNLDIDDYLSFVTKYHNKQYSVITYNNSTGELKYLDLTAPNINYDSTIYSLERERERF